MNINIFKRYAWVVVLWLGCTGIVSAAYQQQVTVTKPDTIDNANQDCVVLLHGLARSASSMSKMAEVLVSHRFIVVNIDYPSRQYPIEVLAENTVPAGVQTCKSAGATRVNFVTHSLGGILLRAFVRHTPIDSLHRVVMLGPPNNGSEVVDSMKEIPGFLWLNGPAGQQLGTGMGGLPASLGEASFELAIIAGTSTINPILSTYLPDPDDGKVSVASTKVDNMCAHVQMAVSHPFLMKDETVIEETVNYLLAGRFASVNADYPACTFR